MMIPMIRVQNEQWNDTYEYAKNVGFGDSDTCTFDLSHLPFNEEKEESSYYAYAHAQITAITEEVYDHAGCDHRNDNDTNE